MILQFATTSRQLVNSRFHRQSLVQCSPYMLNATLCEELVVTIDKKCRELVGNVSINSCVECNRSLIGNAQHFNTYSRSHCCTTPSFHASLRHWRIILYRPLESTAAISYWHTVQQTRCLAAGIKRTNKLDTFYLVLYLHLLKVDNDYTI